MRVRIGWALLAAGAIAISACGDDFEPCTNCGDPKDGSIDVTSGGSAGVSGSAGTGGGHGGSSGAGSGGASGTGGGSSVDGGDGAAGSGGGNPCQTQADCGDAGTMICHPATKTCSPSECSSTMPCPGNEACSYQGSPDIGACVPKCDIAAPTCPNGEMCVPSYGGPQGTCLPVGPNKKHDYCTLSGSSTDCELGLFCAFVNVDPGVPICRQPCDAWTDTVECGTDEACYLGACIMGWDGVNVPIGDLCGATDFFVPCAIEGTATFKWTGVCLDATGGGNPPVCQPLCRTAVATDCDGGKTCVPFDTGYPVGVCL